MLSYENVMNMHNSYITAAQIYVQSGEPSASPGELMKKFNYHEIPLHLMVGENVISLSISIRIISEYICIHLFAIKILFF